MQFIFVQLPNGQEKEVQYSKTKTVLDVKLDLQKSTSLLPKFQFLSFETRELRDEETLSQAGVQENDMLSLQERYDFSSNTIRVAVGDGLKTRVVDFRFGTTVREVLEKVRTLYGLRPEHRIDLEYNGQTLEARATLADYSVQDLEEIRVVTQLAGGGS